MNSVLRSGGNGSEGVKVIGPELFADAIALGSRRAYDDGIAILNYTRFDQRTRQFAGTLISLGVQSGCKVGVHLPPSGDRICLCTALLWLGAVLVPLDPRIDQGRLELAIQSSAIEFLLYELGYTPASAALSGVRTLNLDELLTNTAPHDPAVLYARVAKLSPEHPAVILFGAGDQDSWRGVVLTHAALVANACSLAERLGLGPGQRVAAPLKLNHSARLATVLACLVSGAEIVDTPIPAPNLSHLVLPDDQAIHERLGHLLEADTSAAPVPADHHPGVLVACGDGRMIRRLERLFAGTRVYNSYTRAELAGIALLSDPRDPPHTAHTTVGRPLRGFEVMIVDPRTGMDMLLYEIGEIWIRGAPVMLRYHDAPQASGRARDPNGYFKTGDMGYLDSEGRVVVCRNAHIQI